MAHPHHPRPKGHPHSQSADPFIVRILFEPGGEPIPFLAPASTDIGTRFVVPGRKAGDPPRMGTVIGVSKREHGEILPEVIRPLAPGEVFTQ